MTQVNVLFYLALLINAYTKGDDLSVETKTTNELTILVNPNEQKHLYISIVYDPENLEFDEFDSSLICQEIAIVTKCQDGTKSIKTLFEPCEVCNLHLIQCHRATQDEINQYYGFLRNLVLSANLVTHYFEWFTTVDTKQAHFDEKGFDTMLKSIAQDLENGEYVTDVFNKHISF